MDEMLNNLRWFLIRCLLPEPVMERDLLGRRHCGALMVIPRVVDTTGIVHDATRAFHCGPYTYLFYGPVHEWK
jgi:hypothetical protein